MVEEICWLPYDEDALEKCIGEISDVNGCITCGFFVDETLIKISKKSSDSEYEMILSRAGDIVLTAKKVAEDLQTGLGIITIELSDKKAIIVPTECGTLSILTKKDVNLGMLRLVIARSVESIKKKEEQEVEEEPFEDDEFGAIESLDIDADSLKSMIEKEGLSHLLGGEAPEAVIESNGTDDVDGEMGESVTGDSGTEYMIRGIATEVASAGDMKIRKLQITVGDEINIELSCNLGFLYKESKINEIKADIEKKILEELNKKGMDIPLNLVVKRVL